MVAGRKGDVALRTFTYTLRRRYGAIAGMSVAQRYRRTVIQAPRAPCPSNSTQNLPKAGANCFEKNEFLSDASTSGVARHSPRPVTPAFLDPG